MTALGKIEILDPDSVFRRKDLVELIDYWTRVLRITLGWHYYLDLIWILERIEELKLARDAKIVDAGAGNGLLQFLLAVKGFNVISIDFADREIPFEASRIFRLKTDETGETPEHHRYQEFIKHNRSYPLTRVLTLKNFLRPVRTLQRTADIVRHFLDWDLWREIRAKNPNFGEITYQRADFTKLSQFADRSIDCIVSVSAIEHNDKDGIAKSVRQFERVLKPKGAMFITTSAIKDRDLYLEHCQAWCFEKSTLQALFDLPHCETNYDRFQIFADRLSENKVIKSRIPQFYYENPDSGLPYGKYPPSYLPVGIEKRL